MPDVIVVAIIAGGATVVAAVLTLAGVFAGAALEPVKLRAASRAQLRQTRADRCAKLIESARDVRDAMSDLVFLRESAEKSGRVHDPSTPRSAEIRSRAFTAFMALRPTSALMALSGPDDLARAAESLTDAGRRFAQPPDGHHTSETFPRLLGEFDAAIAAFVTVARKYVQ